MYGTCDEEVRDGSPHAYPVQYSVDYPDRDLDRVSTAFRICAAIPIVIVLGALERWGGGYASENWSWGASTARVLLLAPLPMVLFRQKYPRWWFDWNLELLRFENRIGVYLRVAGRPLPVHRRAAVGPARASLPGRPA